ncbi:phage fiber-tail adaptor protein [Nocardia jiangxiensis]|uniref:phage fiber-tail adaptor protein n=1 Tax=Nocardia jiangxiensis TaxID=282685 RepID=UPI0002DA17CE|nr:hypothetical protein [Nocardia jiangxiensis]
MSPIADEFRKNPGDVLDYLFDWSQWLAPINDTIASSTMAVTSSPSDLGLSASPPNPTFCVVWVSGGSIPNYYTVTNTIVTVGGRTRARSIRIIIENQ